MGEPGASSGWWAKGACGILWVNTPPPPQKKLKKKVRKRGGKEGREEKEDRREREGKIDKNVTNY